VKDLDADHTQTTSMAAHRMINEYTKPDRILISAGLVRKDGSVVPNHHPLYVNNVTYMVRIP
jgi:hypothetical protein